MDSPYPKVQQGASNPPPVLERPGQAGQTGQTGQVTGTQRPGHFTVSSSRPKDEKKKKVPKNKSKRSKAMFRS